MNECVKKLADGASRLSASERAALVEGIMHTFDPTSPAIDAAWAREAADRLEAFRRGEINSVSLDEALASRRRKSLK